MSRSVNELLKSLKRGAGKASKTVEIKNPDIPEPDHEDPVKDRYYMSMRMRSQPRNGTFAMSTPRTARNVHFMADGDINPNVIRKKLDPDHAMPNLNSRTLFEVPTAALRKPHNQIGLVMQSNKTELNWANRFTPQVPSNTQEVKI